MVGSGWSSRFWILDFRFWIGWRDRALNRQLVDGGAGYFYHAPRGNAEQTLCVERSGRERKMFVNVERSSSVPTPEHRNEIKTPSPNLV